MVSGLRNSDYTALFTACGDVRKVAIDGDNLIATIEDEYIYNIIISENNMAILKSVLKDIDEMAKLVIQYVKPEDYVEKDIEILKRKFGNNLVIKEN